jgi:ribosomal protein S18 acetylase RimI-like enzyme
LRPGRAEDLPALLSLWAEDVRSGLHDCVPDHDWLRRQMGDFDWETRSRVVEGRGGAQGLVVVMERPTEAGSVARVEAVARSEPLRQQLLEWGLLFSRAAGAVTAQVWWPREADDATLRRLGLSPVRTFWRMDRSDLSRLPAAPLPDDYSLTSSIDPRVAADTFNRAFADHWRFSALTPGQVPPASTGSELCLLALAPDGDPAAVVWSTVERHDVDTRRQPVGLVNVVGTVPDHRRRGLALALTAEALRRLQARGAASASLYVDASNPTRAFDLYRRLDFQVAYEFEVFEVSWRGEGRPALPQTSNVIS